MSALVLVVAVGAVGVAASPVLFRAAGLTRTATTTRGGLVRGPPGLPRELSAHPRFVEPDAAAALPPADEGPAIADLERLYPDAFPSSPDRTRRPRRGDPPPEPSGTTPPGGVQVGITRHSLRLVDRAGGSQVMGEVDEGEPVIVAREKGEWVLVVHNGQNSLVMGWTRKSEVAVR